MLREELEGYRDREKLLEQVIDDMRRELTRRGRELAAVRRRIAQVEAGQEVLLEAESR